ncbi:MAG: phosphoglucosamine mutase [Spirochaetota bacterium]|jgi:phosphomannomutase|nr:phosphoglucosamine mutase [Spirochaetota bacterium]
MTPFLAGIKASVSGIRGIVGESLTPPVVMRAVMAYAQWLAASGAVGKPQVAIGRDTRSSGACIQGLAASLLLACGIDVIDLGVVPTPTLLLYVRRKALDGGILITASHNPIQWNALKLVKRGGQFLNEEDFASVARNMADETPLYKPAHLLGKITSDDTACALHVETFARTLPLDAIRLRKFRVAIDPGNGAGAVMDALFLNRLGCSIHTVHGAITGDFERPPEPKPEALGALSALVVREKCAVGFAQDPDADRLVLVDENGTALSEEMTLALSAWAYYLPSRSKKQEGASGDIVVNVSTSRLAMDVARHFGKVCHLAKVGEANVLAAMTRHNAGFGGEGNGGVIYPLINPCRDSFAGMYCILKLMTYLREPLSRIVERLHTDIAPRYTMLKEKTEFAGDLERAYAGLRKGCAARGTVWTENLLDGFRMDFADGWLHIRESNTEPAVRIIAEANDAQTARDLMAMMRAALADGV